MTVTDRPIDRHSDGHPPDTDRWVTVSQAALTVGVSERRIRRWLAAGRLPSRDGDGARLVQLADVRRMTVTATVTATVTDRRDGQPDGQVSELVKALDMIDRQQQTILELSGRLGFVMGQLEEARAKIALLEAPAPVPAETAIAGTTNHPASVENGPVRAAQRARSASDRRWWGRLWDYLKLPDQPAPRERRPV